MRPRFSSRIELELSLFEKDNPLSFGSQITLIKYRPGEDCYTGFSKVQLRLITI